MGQIGFAQAALLSNYANNVHALVIILYSYQFKHTSVINSGRQASCKKLFEFQQ